MSQTYNEVVILGDLTTRPGWREAAAVPPITPNTTKARQTTAVQREATRRQTVRIMKEAMKPR